MEWKTMACGLLAAALCAGTQPALAAHSLTQDELTQAKVEANRLVGKKRVGFTFRSRVDAEIQGAQSEEAGRGLNGEAYLLSPYCNVMSLQLEQGRSGRTDFAALETAARNYQLRLRFASRLFDRDAFMNARIVVRQGARKVLVPGARRYTLVRRLKESALEGGTLWHRLGIVLDIPADDIDPSIPVDVSVEGLGRFSVEFRGLSLDGAFDRYDTKVPVFPWSPLHEKL